MSNGLKLSHVLHVHAAYEFPQREVVQVHEHNMELQSSSLSSDLFYINWTHHLLVFEVGY